MKPTPRSIRLAARAVLVHEDRLLLVNAWPASKASELWCAPGGGAEAHESLPANLAREVHEETGLRVAVGAPCLVNEFHSPRRRWHQVEVFFRCTLLEGVLDAAWKDPEGIVTSRRWVTRAEMAGMLVRPAALEAVAWGDGAAPTYDPLELILE
ncbi:NUDIX domain-containing protein [Jannaschia donghaensis]|uniref:Pyrimidine (Deoxy)nucleoside triphosphate pyrophosphohydrolase n=1 Tax=Jannaschia donghaensis TaxID=420998 RepID=A0A0M6YFD4_9RHOB|nr:NUDIX hydrolase [Jannaschia donghaensis]CTQ48644.1 pyrimidine (deoxy)nucleoside triphosphate pyrophosphohydrolase [Jannaschia donghaensis]